LFGDGTTNNPLPLRISDAGYLQGNVQVSIVGTSASVSIFGRASPAMPWVLVAAAITLSGVAVVPLLQEMYAQVTAINAATVDVALNYPCND
ncbi:MAG: hypothetical protein QOI88_900, partial [Gammaproteobacteria bacterium]|nr:hypothetical protein [Gammaproteobacteria bacterium]